MNILFDARSLCKQEKKNLSGLDWSTAHQNTLQQKGVYPLMIGEDRKTEEREMGETLQKRKSRGM